MALLLFFAVTLFAAVLLSCLANRTVLSTAVLFLSAGFLYGSGLLGTRPAPKAEFLQHLSEVALFAVLFTDGMRTGGLDALKQNWRLPGRALLIGMPLTIVVIAVCGHLLLPVSWLWALLIGAILSPTDPVFVSAVFQVKALPERLKRMLNIESGINDGLALPVVVVLLAALGAQKQDVKGTILQLVAGIAVGVIVPLLGIALEQTRFLGAAGLYEPLNAFALGLLVLGISYVTHANIFLAAFASGITIATRNKELVKSFNLFGDLIAELLKLAALLILGARIAPRLLNGITLADCFFVVMAVFLVRPLAILVALLGTGLPLREKLTAGWLGPKGFASVVYGLMILRVGSGQAEHSAQIIALCLAASIVVFSSTDIFVGHWFGREDNAEEHSPAQRPRAA